MYQQKISLPLLKTDYEAFFPVRLIQFVAKWFQPYKAISDVDKF